MIQVLVGAGSYVVRAGLEAIIESSNLQVVRAAQVPILQQVERERPDVVLVEWDRDRLSPLSSSELAGLAGSTPVVVVMDLSEQGAVAEALRLGMRGILPREASTEEIVAAVQAAAAGLTVLHPEAEAPLVPVLDSLARSGSEVVNEALTPREIEVLHMMAEGAGNKAIGRRLGISEHTVKFHVGSILAKLNAGSRTEAVTIGVRQGLVML